MLLDAKLNEEMGRPGVFSGFYMESVVKMARASCNFSGIKLADSSF
jgi:hypothetical protein